MTAVENRLSTPDIIVENATGLTANRRAGNLWTAEARDDMFNRRERGEPWESICQDYPTRSRHAMQQQYSMMKKQRMMAEGTWTTNRRGRKRKVLPTAGMTSVGPRRESGLETTEDEMQSVTPSDLDPDDPDDMPVDEIDIGTPAPETNGSSGPSQSVLDFRPGRPSGLSRSTTDPASAPRGRGRGRGRAASTYTHAAHAAAQADAGHPPLAPKGFTPINEERDGRQSKRNIHENATPPAAKRQKSQAESPSAEVGQSEIKYPFSETTVYFTKDDIHSFFRRGIENGERARKLLEDDQAVRDKAFHDAQGRANRRAYEAEERLKDMGYRHRSDMRNVENQNIERMDGLRYEYDQKIEELKKQLAAASGIDVNSIELPQQQQQQQQQQQPQQPQQFSPPSNQPDPVTGSAVTIDNVNVPTQPGMDPPVESKQVMLLVANLEELKSRWEAERDLRKKAEARATAIAQERTAITLQTLAPDFLTEFQQLDVLVTRLHSEVGDLTPNALAKSLAEIRARCAQVASHFKPHSQAPPPSYTPIHSTDGGSPNQVQAHAPPPPPPPAPMHVHQPIPTPPPQSQHMRTDSGSNSAYRSQTGNAPAHLAPMKMSSSPSPSPASGMRPYESHIASGSHQGLPTPSEPPFESASYEHKRSTPVTINQLLSQEPAIAPAPSLPQPNLVKSPPYEPSRHAHVPTPLSAPPPLSTPLTSPHSEPPRSAHSEQQSHSIKHEHQHQHQHHQSQQQQQQSRMGQPSSHWA